MRTTALFFALVTMLPAAPILAQEKISGSFYGRVGPSDMPVRPRGDNRNQHWETGISLSVRFGRIELAINPYMAGAATFDGADRVQYSASAAYWLRNSIAAELFLTNAMSTVERPVVDPAARHPQSSVNATWFGIRYAPKLAGFDKVSFFARHHTRGNEPLFFAHYTKPYVRAMAGASIEKKLTDSVTFYANPELYWGTHAYPNRGMLNGTIERRITAHLAVEVGGSLAANLWTPQNMRNFRGEPLRKSFGFAFVGIKIPFGTP